MLLGIDHLVIAVDDPDRAAATLEAELGLAATGGGRHESGTYNRIVFLGDAYLELIGAWDRARALGHPIGTAVVRALDAGTPGLVTWALATDGARREVATLHAAGSPIADSVPGSRARPDGEVISWHCAFPPGLGPSEPPFIIEHELAGPEWGAEARRARAAFVHPFGGSARLVGLELAVPDPVSLAAACAAVVGLAVPPGPGVIPGERETRIGEHGLRLVPRRVDGATAVPAAAAGESAGALGGPAAGRSEPDARVAIGGSAGDRVLCDLFGVRFARL
jgi:hypothetical protein